MGLLGGDLCIQPLRNLPKHANLRAFEVVFASINSDELDARTRLRRIVGRGKGSDRVLSTMNHENGGCEVSKSFRWMYSLELTD